MRHLLRHSTIIIVFVLIVPGLILPSICAAAGENQESKLLILWTSGDREVAEKMVFMYAYNSSKRGWWDKVRFIVWGPSARLLTQDKELQDSIRTMAEAGVELAACKACADLYGVSEKLEDLGITVKYIGKELTDLLKSGWVCLTF